MAAETLVSILYLLGPHRYVVKTSRADVAAITDMQTMMKLDRSTWPNHQDRLMSTVMTRAMRETMNTPTLMPIDFRFAILPPSVSLSISMASVA
jgi:hypothetical protein